MSVLTVLTVLTHRTHTLKRQQLTQVETSCETIHFLHRFISFNIVIYLIALQ